MDRAAQGHRGTSSVFSAGGIARLVHLAGFSGGFDAVPALPGSTMRQL
jgi:hypothetical protein